MIHRNKAEKWHLDDAKPIDKVATGSTNSLGDDPGDNKLFIPEVVDIVLSESQYNKERGGWIYTDPITKDKRIVEGQNVKLFFNSKYDFAIILDEFKFYEILDVPSHPKIWKEIEQKYERRMEEKRNSIWLDISEKGAKCIRDYNEKIEKTVLSVIKIKLEERGYDFDNDESFMYFIKDELGIVRTRIVGDLLNSSIVVYLGNDPIVVFDLKTEYAGLSGIEATIKMRDDISDIPKKISSLRGKMTKQTADEIDKQIEGLRNEWERDV